MLLRSQGSEGQALDSYRSLASPVCHRPFCLEIGAGNFDRHT